MKKIIERAFYFTVGVLLLFTITYCLSFGVSPLYGSKEAHSKWAEFFTMLAGIGAILAPIISLATIYFLYGQVQGQKEDYDLQKKRDDVAFEFKEIFNMTFEWSQRQVSGEVIVGVLSDCLKANCIVVANKTKNSSGEFVFQWGNVDNSTATPRYSADITIAKTGTLSQWIAKANKLLLEDNISLYQVFTEEQNHFQSLAASLSGHLVSLLMFAEKANDVGVDKTSIKFRLQYFRNLVDLVHKGKLLDSEFLVKYDALIASCTE